MVIDTTPSTSFKIVVSVITALVVGRAALSSGSVHGSTDQVTLFAGDSGEAAVIFLMGVLLALTRRKT